MNELVLFDMQYSGPIGGIDEAGRGPLAGPVSCAAVVMAMNKIIDGINDSKKLAEKKREMLYDKIIETAVCWSVILIDNSTIDTINILQATKKGMKEAYESLLYKPDIMLIDAVRLDIPNSVSIIGGDAKSYNIAAASILAKVTRDRYMRKAGTKYPEYGFDKHKGYGTELHIEMLKKYGACPLHRKSFIGNIFYD